LLLCYKRETPQISETFSHLNFPRGTDENIWSGNIKWRVAYPQQPRVDESVQRNRYYLRNQKRKIKIGYVKRMLEERTVKKVFKNTAEKILLVGRERDG
jgi:hypothetical protein